MAVDFSRIIPLAVKEGAPEAKKAPAEGAPGAKEAPAEMGEGAPNDGAAATEQTHASVRFKAPRPANRLRDPWIL